MKKTILIITVTFILSVFVTIACTIEPAEAITTANLQSPKGNGPDKPVYITLEEAQVLIDSAVQKALSADPLIIDGNVNFTKGINSDFGSDWGNIEFRNIFYSRRETQRDPSTNIRFLEEINDRDWQIQVSTPTLSRGTAIWLDGNPDQSNITLDANGQGSNSKLWINSHWYLIQQQNGIYNFTNIKTFNSNDEAKAFFSANGLSRLGTIYRTPDGTVKATY